MVGKHASRVTLASLVVVVAMVSCFDDPSRQNTPIRQEHIASSTCSNSDAVSRGKGKIIGTQVLADLDGDGTDEEVYIHRDDSGDPGCRSFVVVDAGLTTYTIAADPEGAPRALPVPRINSLADVDADGRPEIVVDIEMGASTQFAGLFTMTDAGLERVEMRGNGPGPFASEFADHHLFPYGGSVGHMEGVDCLDGMVVLSAALPKGDSADSYEVERRFFAPEGTRLVLDDALTEKIKVDSLRIEDFPEFAGSPFGSCGTP